MTIGSFSRRCDGRGNLKEELSAGLHLICRGLPTLVSKPYRFKLLTCLYSTYLESELLMKVESA